MAEEHGLNDYCDEVDHTLHECLHQRAEVHRVDGGEVPTWSIAVGNRIEQVTLYDVEQYRSVETADRQGLNEQRTTKEAVQSWFTHKFQ